jgi:hypothetical protein
MTIRSRLARLELKAPPHQPIIAIYRTIVSRDASGEWVPGKPLLRGVFGGYGTDAREAGPQ